MKKIILLVIFTIILTGCEYKEKEESKKITETNGMLSYTIDGEKTDIKPTKEDGYIVNKIICDNGSDMMWDNDNWEVELTKINSKDRCKVDFTKDTSTSGYRITITSNDTSSLDSLSKATTENGTVIIYSKSKIESVTGCNGIIEDNKVIVSNITSNQTCNIIIEQTLADAIKVAYNANVNRKRKNFSAIDNGTPNLYTGTDDQGTTYYFSGDGSTMNNWVKFADKWWRVIRINGNGSVRLLYAGDGILANDIGYSAFNSTYNNPMYVGWKYGSETNGRGNTASTIYGVVNSWYTNLDNIYKNYVDTVAIYCNDRNLASGSSYSTSSNFYYAAYTRLITNKAPIFICSNNSDKFTTFGLMTADEIAYAGGLYGTNSPKAYYYLNLKASDESTTCTGKSGDPCSITGNANWWTMSPSSFESDYTRPFAYMVYGSGTFSSLRVDSIYVVRPVISLKPEVLVTGGDGSGTNPYTVTLP